MIVLGQTIITVQMLHKVDYQTILIYNNYRLLVILNVGNNNTKNSYKVKNEYY